MEAQRHYFEEQLRRIDREKIRKIQYLEDEYAHLLDHKDSYEKKARELLEEKKRVEKKVLQLEKKCKETQKETEFLKQINDALKQNQNEWKQKVEQTEKKLEDDSKDRKIQDLQVRYI